MRVSPLACVTTRPHAARGFTLIEMMVAISLLGILFMLAAPAFTSWIRNSQVRTVAEALQGGLRVAQAEALRRNRQVVMSFTNSVPTSGTTAVVGGKNWALQTVSQFGDAAEYITGGSLTGSAAGVSVTNGQTATAVCFNSAGRVVTNTSGTGVSGASCTAPSPTLNFDIVQTPAKTDDRPLRVVLQLGGQLRMCDPARPTLSPTSPDGCP